jgi:4-hydroxymandelate oxidase
MLKALDSFLGFFEHSDIDRMLSQAEQEHLSKGAVLIEQGSKSDGIYVVVHGGFDILLPGRVEPIGRIGVGEVVGGIAFLDSRSQAETIVANENSTVLSLRRSVIETLLIERPELAIRFYRALGTQVSQLYRQELHALTPEAEQLIVEPGAPGNLADIFRQSCDRFAEREAYVIDGRWINYGEACERVERLAASLAGLQPQSDEQLVIATLLPNCEHILETFYAAAVSGAVVFPVNHRLAAGELVGVLKTSGAGVLVTSSSFAPVLSQLDWSSLAIHSVVWTEKVTGQFNQCQELLYSSLVSPHLPRIDCPAPDPEAYLQCFGTSGTTGTPKVILHAHKSVAAHSVATMAALRLLPSDAHCWGHFGPMFHVGDAAFVWVGTMLGARHVFNSNPLDFKGVAELMSSAGVTICKISPSMLKLMVLSGVVSNLRFPELRWILTGGAAPDPTLVRQTAELFGCDFIQGYGMTEATCHVAFKNETQAPLRDGMAILPGLDLKILDDERAMVEAGQIGEVAIRGVTVFHAQIANGKIVPAPAAAFTTDGYYLSGDLGYLDAHGKLHISGRSKDMINVGGENVFAAEVEQIVYRMQGIKQCAAFSMPHPDLGEVVEMAVVRAEAGLNTEKVLSWCKQLLASYKVPRRVYFLDELPMTPTGKVRKQQLRDIVLAKKESDLHALPKAPQGGSNSPMSIRPLIQESLHAIGVSDVAPSQSLFEAGLDSLGALDLIERLQISLGADVPPSLLYEHPTIDALVKYFEEQQPTQEYGKESPTPDVLAKKPDESVEPIEGRRLAAPIALLCQGLGLLLRPAMIAASIVPTVLLVEYAATVMSPVWVFLMGPLFLALMLVLTMGFAWACKWLIVGRQRAGRFALESLAYHRWLVVNNLFRSLEPSLGVLRGSGVLRLFYALCGARLGVGVRIEASDLQDLDLVEIREGSYLGREANLQPAVLKDGALALGAIYIGERSVIGPQASVLGPVRLPPASCVLPLDATASASEALPVSPLPPLWARLAGYLLVGYAVTAAISAGIYLLVAFSDVPMIWAFLAGHAPLSGDLRFFALLAVVTQFVIPAAYFLIVLVLKRLVLGGLVAGKQPGIRHWIYSRLTEIPFLAIFLRLTVMSHATKWAYQLLGSRVGARPFIAAPHTSEPELITFEDGAMVAGNVAIYAHDPVAGQSDNVVVGKRAIIANSCLLTAGSHLGDGSLLGDLSRHGGNDVSLPKVIAVGRPPRVVGEPDLEPDTRSTVSYATFQFLLVALQLLLVIGGQLPGFLALGLALSYLAGASPWLVIALLPVLLLLPRGLKVLLLPVAKWSVLGEVREGEHAAYGGMWVRWIVMEALVMDLERTLVPLRGTRFLPALYRALGAKVEPDVCLMSSALGSEYDLKTIKRGAALNHRSLFFGHSIERHTLIFRATTMGENASLGACSILEAGAVLPDGTSVQPHKAVHARRQKGEEASSASKLINVKDFQDKARTILPQPVFDYYAGGSGDEVALNRNANVFDRMTYSPQVLVDVSKVSTQIELLGRTLSSPMLVAPMAMNRLAHPEGEVAVARAVRKLGLGVILSTLSSTPVETVKAELGDDGLALLQLYVLKNRSITEALVHRAADAGCSALVLTVDAPVSGRREKDIRNSFSVASGVELPHLDGMAADANSRLLAFERAKDPSLTWEHLKWLTNLSPCQVWLKGVMRPDDALRAIDHGVSGIILSNHGGRQFDSAPSALQALPAVRRAIDVSGNGQVPLLVDGGIRRGEHILKALALGANAVLVGRPVLWGLANGGESGVSQVLGLLHEELSTAMRLAGCPNVSSIDPQGIGLQPDIVVREKVLLGG